MFDHLSRKRRHCNPSICHKFCTGQYGVTSEKICNFSNTAVRTANIVLFSPFLVDNTVHALGHIWENSLCGLSQVFCQPAIASFSTNEYKRLLFRLLHRNVITTSNSTLIHTMKATNALNLCDCLFKTFDTSNLILLVRYALYISNTRMYQSAHYNILQYLNL